MKIITVLLLTCGVANASEVFHLVNGKTVETETALLAALRGESVYRCQAVEAKTNKKGTSISLRTIKAKKGGAK